jgi:outer membrane cobalamin receptor
MTSILKATPRSMRRSRIAFAILSLSVASPAVWADDDKSASAVVLVEAGRFSEVGIASSASVGMVTQKELAARTVYRPGELLEATPGLIVSQHSGEGKANQFYLRGFNLDHGTDLRTTVDGMVVNQRSHSHGQGWTDLNFLIPELADRMEYKKGPYYAEEGDFSSAGAINIVYQDKLPTGLFNLGVGENGYRRGLVADSPRFANGNLLYALELVHNDGPFVHPDNFRKVNGVLRYSEGGAENGFKITAMAYQGKWNSTDQIPQRAIDSGLISNRFDALDPSDGGESHRYSLSADWRKTTDTSTTRINAYVIDWRLDLFSNFTYFLDDPVNGDQFSQPDRRVTTGFNIDHIWQTPWLGRESESKIGLQLLNDNIHNGLNKTRQRELLAVVRQDHVVESSVGLYFENTTRWSDKFRTIAGLREDYYRFDVNSDNRLNSGNTSASLASPKLNFIFGPWNTTELYVNVGRGFHSNDARGTTISVDPKTGLPVSPVPALVKSTGIEAGVRFSPIPGVQSSFSLYRLDFDSELVFVGDAGTTEAGRPSRRVGVEFNNSYKLKNWLSVDADLAFARARYRDIDPAGQRIPGAVEGVASVALTFDNRGPWFGSLQWRYFGPRPLIEDNSVRSHSTTTLNARIGYKISPTMRVELEGFNLTNRTDSAIDYYYQSRLPGEAAEGVNDVHFHPIESRSFRVNLAMNF